MATAFDTSGFATFRSLERERYVSDTWFEREMEAIHQRMWLYGCHLSEIPQPGSYVLRRVAPDESIIIIRVGPDEVRALFNVCRHRGSRICDAASGSVRALRCPYHNWTYTLEGELVRTPGLGSAGRSGWADLSLGRAHVEVWCGHVFINLDPARPSPLGPQLAAAAPTLASFRPERNRVAERRTYPIAANWKLVMENFWECYHCPTGHAQFCFAADIDGLTASDFSDVAESGADIPLVIEGPLPLKPGMRTLSTDGTPVSTVALGDFADHGASGRAETAGFLIRHSTAATYFEDHAIVLDFQPVDAQRTDLVMRWLVDEDAVEGRDFEMDRLTELFDITNQQDRELCERNQAGVRSRRYRPGPCSVANEAGVLEFHRFCEQCLRSSEEAPLFTRS